MPRQRVLRRARVGALVVLLVLLLGSGLAATAPAGSSAPARAAPLVASLYYDIDSSNLTWPELRDIDRGLKGTFDFLRNRRPVAWGCITELRGYEDTGYEDPPLDPLAPPVRVDVRISRPARLESRAGESYTVYFGDYTVAVTLSVRGQPARTRSVTFAPADGLPVTFGRGGTDPEDLRRIGNEANNLLDALMGEVQPCRVLGTLQLRGDFSGPAIATTIRVEAEGELQLRADGTTEAAIAATYTRTQSGACTLTTTATGQLQVGGSYRADDGALLLQLRLSVDPEAGSGICGGEVQCVAGGGTITCTGPGGSASQPAPGFALDLTPGDGVVIALADQAHVALPRAAGWFEQFSWDASFQLTYGDGSGGPGALGRVVMVTPPPAP